MIDLAKKHLIFEEGIRLHPYQDSEGYWTIGVGHLIDNRRGGALPFGVCSFPIPEQMAMQILLDDIHKVHTPLARDLEYWDDLGKIRQVCLISMAFQLGLDGLYKFKKMLSAVEFGHYATAADEMLDSRWAIQTANRANRISRAMRNNDAEWLNG